MKNGLYSIHIHMLDGVKGRDSGVLILRDGVLLGGGPYFWSRGAYTIRNGNSDNGPSEHGTWKGELVTTSIRRLRMASPGHCSAEWRQRAASPGRSATTRPRCSAPCWSQAIAASVFARA
ncbi:MULTISPECIES: hypothetical protein [Bradyrhizobium]|uniref:hypothetical protein n=1 Tax=Bradyrhizobium TaxID=374 RepID=UPI001F0A0686|nr:MULTISPECIES: hypothetical protein [Bradyrhizobium]WOH55381.1 hypothetical protein RX329_24075 [Bradyrhizobium sp. BWC-3-1]